MGCGPANNVLPTEYTIDAGGAVLWLWLTLTPWVDNADKVEEVVEEWRCDV